MNNTFTINKWMPAVAILLISILSGFKTYAQNGSVNGVVTDNATGEKLTGVTVKIKNKPVGMATDVDGKYVLVLEPGTYAMEVSYVGYVGKELSDVVVKVNEATVVNVGLDFKKGGTNLRDVVVRSSARRESVNALYNAQKNSALIQDGISADVIARSPDKNTGDVLKRVSGASVQDNKFVVVRGLSDRYNTALLDNSVLPSTEPNRKAFSFDIVPSSLVDNIVVSKTATPDLPGDFTGGAIQISTKDIPVKNFVGIGITEGFNTQTSFKDFYHGERAGSQFLGFTGGKFDLPAGFPSISKVGELSAAEQTEALKSLPRDWTAKKSTAIPVQGLQLSVGRVHNGENGKRVGGLFALTYRNTPQIITDNQRHTNEINYTDDQYRNNVNLGALLNLGYNFGGSKITFKNVFNRVLDEQYLYRTAQVKPSPFRFYAYDLIEKTLVKSTLEGVHQAGEKGKFNWVASYNYIGNDQPDQKKIGYSATGGATGMANLTSVGKDNARLFSTLKEHVVSGALNYTRSLSLGSSEATFKGGISDSYRNRNFSVRFLGTRATTQAEQEGILNLPLEQLFTTENYNKNYFRLDDVTSGGDNYGATSNTAAGYAMMDNKLGNRLRAVWGLRVEHYMVNLKLKPDNETAIDQKQFDFMPSVNLTYNAGERSKVRAAYFRTVARPEFRELAPFAYYDYELLASLEGSPKLKRAQINNFDLRYEFYPSAGQILSVSGFYKDFTNAIEVFNYDANSSPIFTYFNSKKATLYGVEVEARKNLDFIGTAEGWKNTTVYANVSLIKSKVTNPEEYANIEKTRKMVGQAPYLINAGIQHSAAEGKVNVNLLYNRVGTRIYVAAGQQYPSLLEMPRNLLDAQVAVKAFSNKGEFKLTVSDILNSRAVFYYDNNSNGKYDRSDPMTYRPTADQNLSYYRTGTNFTLSFNYTF